MYIFMSEGQLSVKKIRKEKEKHVWAVQVLNEILRHVNMYDGSGGLRASQRQKSERTNSPPEETSTSDNDSNKDSDEDIENDIEELRDDISDNSMVSERQSTINSTGM